MKDAVDRDLGITEDRNPAIGRLAFASARLTLEAAGTAVTLGFIDFHSHADLAVLD